MYRKQRWFFPFLLFSLSLQAQEPDLNKIRSSFQGENAALLQQKEHLNIRIKDTSLVIFSDNTFEIAYLSDNAGRFASKAIYYSTFSEIEDIDAKTFAVENGSKKTFKVNSSAITTSDYFGKGVFYGGSKVNQFIFPGAQKDARSLLTYREVIKDPHFLGAFYFASFIPVIEAEFSVTFPKEVKIKYRLFGKDTSAIRFSKVQKGKMTTYTWSASQMKGMPYEQNAPDIDYYEPHVIVYIDEYTVKGETKKVLSDVRDLYKWYFSLVKEVNKSPDPVLRAITDSVVAGVKSDEEKVKKIFYWVQDQIKYVAFEEGMGGFVPREAAAICSKRFGDCKDMASIITAMLNYAGVKAWLTWIGTRDIPYTYEQVPTPLVDNHMIACVELNGKKYFLDATGICTPLGFPTSMIQGKEALIGKNENEFEIAKVPPVEMNRNTEQDSVWITVENNTIKGSGQASLSGYNKMELFYVFYNRSEKEREDALKKYVQKGNNKFSASSVKTSDNENRDLPTRIQYEFTLPDYAKVSGDEIYINLNLVKDFQNEYIDTAFRKLDIEEDFAYQLRDVAALKIPEGYTISYLPANSSYSKPEFGYTITYTRTPSAVSVEKNVFINHLLLKKEQFTSWNEMVKQLDNAYKEVIVLKKVKP